MKREIKIVIIGAGSTYTPELIEGLIKKRNDLDIRELALMDIDSEKLEIVGNMARRMLAAKEISWPVNFYDTYNCVSGADYVITQIRVGKLLARINDEKIPLKYGMIGQETCGIGGFFKALRTIPVLYRIAEKMQTLCPNAVMINFTNPSGIVAQALLRKKIRSVGLCNCPFAMEKSVKETLGLETAEIDYVGLNHLSWLTAIRCNGKDYLEQALKSGVNSVAMKNIPANGFDSEILQAVRGIPSTYLEYYYFKFDKLKKLQREKLSRGEVCLSLERKLLEKYKNPSLNEKPPELEQRGGAYYSTVAVELLEAIENDRGTRHVINVRNDGAFSFMDDDDVIEGAAIVGRDKIDTIPLRSFDNEHIIGLMKLMKSYEKLAVEAAVTGDRQTAISALLLNPLCGDYRAVSSCYDEMHKVNEKFLYE